MLISEPEHYRMQCTVLFHAPKSQTIGTPCSLHGLLLMIQLCRFLPQQCQRLCLNLLNHRLLPRPQRLPTHCRIFGAIQKPQVAISTPSGLLLLIPLCHYMLQQCQWPCLHLLNHRLLPSLQRLPTDCSIFSTNL
jgi:hypothetical protein